MDYALEQKQDQYGDSMVFVSIHPNTMFNDTLPGPSFTTNFNIEEGEQLFNDFNLPVSIPEAMINREESSPGQYPFNTVQIDGEVDARIGIAAKFDMSCTAYMNASREIISEVTITNLDTTTGVYRMVNYIVEDSIIDWQIVAPGQHPDYTGSVDDSYSNYAHRFVLRDVNQHIGVLEGAPIFTGELYGTLMMGFIPVGSSTVITENSHPMPIGWNENKISVVSFIIDTLSREVMQVINTPAIVPVSTEEIESVSLNLYPNPANEYVIARLSHHLNNARVKVINMNGSFAIDQVMNSDQVAIDVSSLSPGIYSIIIQHMNGIVSKRLVVE